MCLCGFLSAQVANDDRVLIQGFYWESTADRFEDWYEYVEGLSSEMSSAGIDMIWLPPPSDAGAFEGYLPRELNNFSNAYGTLSEHQSLLSALDNHGIEAIADIVINHRVGSTNWIDFTNPTWGTNSITGNDEVWSQPEYSHITLRGNNDTGTQYGPARDIDHTQGFVQTSIVNWMNTMKGMGYDGWRYDFVHGFDEYYIGLYNGQTSPSFSVGEYWTNDKQTIQDWIDATGSTAFDFPTYYALKGTIRDNNYSYLAYEGVPSGGIGWDPRNYTTFIENHDTPSYDPNNNVLNGNNVGQAYAYLLTHPGIPTVFWSHMFEWGTAVKDEIKSLIAVRKGAGIHSQSAVEILASETGLYVAKISGSNNDVIIKMGYDNWGSPENEGQSGNWTLSASGTNYAIWTSGGAPGGDMTVYVQGFTHAYAWDSNLNPLLGAWPGAALQSNPDGWDSIVIAADCANVIFSNNGSGQTDDLYTCKETPYYHNGAWHAEKPGVGGDMTVFVQGYTHVYAWDDNLNPLMGGWPGTALTAGSWNSATIPAECSNLIFSNNGANQTADLATCSTAPYYHQGSWHTTEPNTGGQDLTVYAQGYTHAYAWDDNLNQLLGAWPGSALTQGSTWNHITISDPCANVIFSYNGGSQTADLNTCAPNGYWYNGSWHDSDPLSGSRLRSEVNSDLSVQVWPNPFTDRFNVQLHADERSMVEFWVVSLSGQKAVLFRDWIEAGTQQIELSSNNIPFGSGVMIGKLRIGDEIKTMRIIQK